ncbi:3-hydroxyacyl-ACP dehydratase FabZ [Oceanithermus sp.]
MHEILELLPHRYPFLLIDRILEADAERFKVLKNVTFNEPFFPGHFPGHPVMPGVLIVEAMAQASVASLARRPDFEAGQIAYLAGVDGARFLKPVTPGDALILEGTLRYRRGLGKSEVSARVEGEEVARAQLTFVVRSR